MERSEAIKNFLLANSPLAYLYKKGMETHVLGTDKTNTFRIKDSESETKQLIDCDSISAIGMSGWNFSKQISEWVGFDFDSIVSHTVGLNDAELTEIIVRAKAIPWVRIIKSTSGKGLHLYVFIKNSPVVDSRKRHILLAQQILSTLSGLLNFDFKAKVDTCGTILWIWRRNQAPDAFEVISDNIISLDCSKLSTTVEPAVKQLSFTNKPILLDDEHQKLLTWFANRNCTWWFDAEINMLVAHTYDLSEAHKELNLRGYFYTISKGTDCPNDQNCFAFPISNGAWIVRRHTKNTPEHKSWGIDSSGWRYVYFNRIPRLEDVAKLNNGQMNAKQEWIFPCATDLENVFKYITANLPLEIPDVCRKRQFRMKLIKDNKVVVFFEKVSYDKVDGWVEGKKHWEKVFPILEQEKDTSIPDDLVRHVVSQREDAGWFLRVGSVWVKEPKENIISVLKSYTKNINETMAHCITNPWHLVCEPFKPEYLGNRQWNKAAPQLTFTPAEGEHPTWDSIFEHLGTNLDSAIENNQWCRRHSISKGSEYLLYWVASIFQAPTKPLPYLFFFGPENCGKSILHEGLRLLVNRGVVSADNALINPQRFNKELEGAILCITEEINLTKNPQAYERIKAWVTGLTINIHEKGQTPIDVFNTTHWMQCANKRNFCPVAIGDTRIVVIEVSPLKEPIPKDELLQRLKKEAAAFTHTLLNIEIPPPQDRLRIPVVITEHKIEEEESNANIVEQFLMDECIYCEGHIVSLAEFCDKFRSMYSLSTMEWSNRKVSAHLPLEYKDKPLLKGKYGADSNAFLGNISLDKSATRTGIVIRQGERLVVIPDH